jgi:hypothetical protein
MKRFIIGDIHGQYDMLKALLDDVGFNPAEGDILYGLGDFCDRGNQNLEVLRYLMSLGDSFKSVFGNHDIWIWQYLHEPVTYNERKSPYMLRDAEECWIWNGGRTTEDELYSLDDDEGKRIFDWIGKLPYKIELDKYTIVHTPSLKPVLGGNIDQTTLTLAETMEKNLCEKDYDSWFWDRDIIAYSSVFSGRGTSLMTEDNKDSWGLGKKVFIIGHTPLTEGPLYDPYLQMIALDTGAFVRKEIHKVEGKLTILNLDTMEYNQVDGNLNKFNGKIELV